MDENRIAEIVRKVFEKAKKEHASHSRYALSNHISGESDLSSKTLERAYDRYINGRKKWGIPYAESVDLFCKYLEFEDYADYVRKNPVLEQDKNQASTDIVEENTTEKNWIKITILIALGMVLVIIGLQKWPGADLIEKNTRYQCMTWADSLFITISCDKGPYSQYGTSIEPLDEKKLRNMRKEKVNMAYKFFTEDGKPLIWYHKTKEDEIEYFTAPGLHPVYGETLRKITPYIIEKYVPIHNNSGDSFVE